MNNSSAQPSYSITSSNSLDTITIDLSSISSINYTDTIVLNSVSSAYTWTMPEEFVDSFPNYDRIQHMCEQYPGLKIAYEKFVTTYKLVKDDYDTPKDKK